MLLDDGATEYHLCVGQAFQCLPVVDGSEESIDRRRPRSSKQCDAALVAGSSDWTDQCVVISPKLWARATACARFSEPSLMNMCLTCDFTVSGAMASERAISLLERPWE
jgi:hypothetical protein